MTNTQHTPGPWTAKQNGPNQNGKTFFEVHLDTGKEGLPQNAVGTACFTVQPMWRPEEAEANARLIAEAPAMLDALRLVSDFLAVKLDEGQACILEDEVNAILSRIDGDVALEV